MALNLIHFPRFSVIKEDRGLHYEERNVLYSSPNIIRLLESREMRWVGHVACTGDRRVSYRVFVVRPDGKRQLKNVGLYVTIILKCILKK
jgi:hypothetical protein